MRKLLPVGLPGRLALVGALVLGMGLSAGLSGAPAAGAARIGASHPAQAGAGLRVTWMAGFAAPRTPARYDKVGVIKVGAPSARNVLVLEPGTSAGAAYFVPLAKWIVSQAPGWQVWSVERRENLLEDQSVLDRFKAGTASAREVFDYYLGWLTNPRVKHHLQLVANTKVDFAKTWGMNVAVHDLRAVITAAEQLGGKVVLGGHSLGGSVVTAYATWDFHGTPGADGLAGLVYIDGGSFGSAVSASAAKAELKSLDAPKTSPWLAFGGIQAPYAGVFMATGSTAALFDPNARSLGQASGLLPKAIVPKVPVTNLGQYGYALNVGTSPSYLEAAQAHLGKGVSPHGPVHGWDGAGALTPIRRYATMFSGGRMPNVDGTEWYFPQRLTDDTGAVDQGNANPAQAVLGLHATMGHDLPHSLLIYAFGAHLGGSYVLQAARQLAAQSGIPASQLTLVNGHGSYAHNDPAGAYPNNVFFSHLIAFLDKVAPAR